MLIPIFSSISLILSAYLRRSSKQIKELRLVKKGNKEKQRKIIIASEEKKLLEDEADT